MMGLDRRRVIPFSRVDCSGNELKYVREVLESGWLTTAGKCAALEKAFADRVGAKYACAVNSATAALHLAAEAMGIGPGDKVFVPTMTFTASAEVIRYLGADPLFLDVEYGTCLLTPEILEAGIRRHPGAKAVVAVHYGGQAVEMDGLLSVCRREGIRVIEDAAHAFPARYKGRMVGSLGDVTCFSFYANKTMTTGEGGMLVTDDETIYRRSKIMRLHGIDRDIWNRFTSNTPNWEYDVVAPGYKYNLPDVAAAIGMAQLERADEFHAGRRRCAEFYFDRLKDVEGVDLPALRERIEDHAWHLFPVVVTPAAPITRNDCLTVLADHGIGTSVHYKPLHRMSYYRNRYGLKPDDFPNAERIWAGCLSLPIYPTLTDLELGYICEALREALLENYSQ